MANLNIGTWERPASAGPPREFMVSAELYVSTTAGAALRKPPTQPRKKADKRDSKTPLTDDKKIKEKSSWLTLARGPAGAGHWRTATCKLTEEGERCLLNIYVDETILYQTVYIHLLNHTDIRQADSSLFFRKDCIGIYCATGQRWSSFHSAEPVYLQFPHSDACNAWLALMRSYAIPEIYGRRFFPEDGGSYRMWRQVELSVFQGRNIGNTISLEPPKVGVDSNSDPEPDAVDSDVSCEIHLNDTLCGRTTVKKGVGFPDWHENFVFSDLPPFDTLDVIVWREKKLFKPAVMGSVRITLSNFRRGEPVEGWFPILHSGPIASDIQVGDLRLKIRVDEEIILPYSAYSGLLTTFDSRNFLDWMTDFETKLRLKTISSQLMSLAVAKNVLVEQVFELADREVDETPSSHQTLFRGNTILTKVMELSMSWYGRAFLEASIGNVLRKLCAEKVAIEVDPVRSGKGTKDVERNVELLIYWCQEFWNSIYAVRAECPSEMRKLFEHIRKLVERRYQIGDSPEQKRELPWQSVSAFCFLRFIVPAILHPHLFGLCPGLPSVPVQRSLTLIAKVIQSLANLNASLQKEEFMRGVRDFLKNSLPAMVDYIRVVSTPADDLHPSSPATDQHDRLNIVNSLRQRVNSMPVLARESIPMLPHLLDIPRHLAVIVSAVIRSSKDYQFKPGSDEVRDPSLDEFCARCFDVEEHALHRVTQLAHRIQSDRRRPGASSFSVSPSRSQFPSSPLHSYPARPSTAPAVSDSYRQPSDSMPSSPSHSHAYTRDTDRDHRGIPKHLKSTSTDSIPLDHSTAVDIDDPAKRRRGILRGILRR